MKQVTLGDPTLFGNLQLPEHALQALQKNATSLKWNGYPPAIGK